LAEKMMAAASGPYPPPQGGGGHMQQQQHQDPRMMYYQQHQQQQHHHYQQRPPLQQPPPPLPPPSQQQQYRPPPNMMHSQQYPPMQPPPPPQQQQSPPLTLRIILTRDEVNYLFGFDGVLINQLRQQTGANIQLTDPSSYEQVLTISGSLELIFKAFSLVCRKLWDFLAEVTGGAQRPLVLRLAVPASQCGSIIGKHGAKVKEIRDLTGANIQVAQDGLPDSTERCVEISGTGEACLQCTYHICCILQEAPIRGEVMPYTPKSALGPAGPPGNDNWKPVFLCGDKAYILDGDVAVPAPPDLLRRELAKTSLGEMAESLASLNGNNSNYQQQQQQQPPAHMNPLALMQAISNSQRNAGGNAPQTSKEMSISAELVGLIIGKGGTKIAEIRRISGAQLHINQDEELPATGERVITISGTEECILLAQFLIQSNIDMAMKEGLGPMQQQQGYYGDASNGGPQQQQQNGGGNWFPPNNDPRRNGGGGGGFRSGGFRGGHGGGGGGMGGGPGGGPKRRGGPNNRR
jgi:poly(rC)-binding protein 2/3/4